MNKRTVVYRNLKTGKYLVQPYTIGPVAATEFGEPTVIQPGEFVARIAEAVTKNLESFGTEKYEKSRAILRDDKQQRAFLRDHLGVSVNKRESGEMVIYALHREGGGMVGSDDDTFILSQNVDPEKLTAAIVEAFRRAT